HSRPVFAFDYHYETSYTDGDGVSQTESHDFSAVIVDFGVPLKPLVVREEQWTDKLASVVGFKDVQCDSPAFNKAFRVLAADPVWANAVLGPSTMESLLQSPRFYLEFRDQYALVLREKTFAPQDFDAALDLATGVLDRIPDSLVR